MTKNLYPITAAIRFLRAERIAFEPHLYRYRGQGTAGSARALAVPEERVIKTLVLENEKGQALVVLMPGTLEVSTKKLARELDVKSVAPCSPQAANKHSGYLLGGTSPFGMRKKLPIYMETRILAHSLIYINGGKRGFLVAMKPEHLQTALEPMMVEIGV